MQGKALGSSLGDNCYSETHPGFLFSLSTLSDEREGGSGRLELKEDSRHHMGTWLRGSGPASLCSVSWWPLCLTLYGDEHQTPGDHTCCAPGAEGAFLWWLMRAWTGAGSCRAGRVDESQK